MLTDGLPGLIGRAWQRHGLFLPVLAALSPCLQNKRALALRNDGVCPPLSLPPHTHTHMHACPSPKMPSCGDTSAPLVWVTQGHRFIQPFFKLSSVLCCAVQCGCYLCHFSCLCLFNIFFLLWVCFRGLPPFVSRQLYLSSKQPHENRARWRLWSNLNVWGFICT